MSSAAANGFLHPALPQPGRRAQGYLRGFGYQGSASRQGWERAVAELGVGGTFKDAMAQTRSVARRCHGVWRDAAESCEPHLDRPRRAWTMGSAGAGDRLCDGENERLMRRDMMNDMPRLLEAAGATSVSVYDNDYAPGMGIHEMGTARWAATRRRRC
jgi:hypothetical protein